MSIVLENLKDFFKESDGFEISLSGKYIRITNLEKKCLLLEIEPRGDKIFIIVDLLNKCNLNDNVVGSGSYNMKQLKLLADAHSEYVIEIADDSSEVTIITDCKECIFSLKMMFIMSKGETWYNILGFHEKNYTENTRMLKNFIEKPIEEIDDFLEAPIETSSFINYLKTDKKFKGKSIKEVFTLLFNFIKQICKVPTGKCKSEHINYLYDKLYYFFMFGFKEDIQNAINEKTVNLYYPEQNLSIIETEILGGKNKKITRRYLPKVLTRKDRKIQSKELQKSRKLYKKGIYYSRRKVSSYPHVKSPHVIKAEKIYKVDKIGATNELAKATGCSVKALAKIINKGEGAYFSSGSRPNQSAQSWGIARLASSISAGKAAARDYNILESGCKPNSKALRLAKQAKGKYGHGTRRVPKAYFKN